MSDPRMDADGTRDLTNRGGRDGAASHAIAWITAGIFMLAGIWFAVVLPLGGNVFGALVPGLVALVSGLGIIVVLARRRSSA
ncbi:hypothetical protein [Microbacterium rhizomatis]|uniref:Uncharacterized protein n=1 Tax=Microbacterium rhizomatis TaxID=1631477 RepID=A0A5J5IWH2_9MICO|nr:hypothetical protein [Microbacterium rhizomatis]KAA9105054.1 hypothetical protein F6B43_18585 [Microbacterium rhizomatis]